MATMLMHGVACNVVYVEAGAPPGGNGSAPNTPLNALPPTGSMTSNTVYLCRRKPVTSFLTLTNANWGSSVNNLYILGMPKPTDLLYQFVPPEVKPGGIVDWSSDSPDYAPIRAASVTQSSNFYGADFGTSRVWWIIPNNGDNTGNSLFRLTNNSNGRYFFTHCKFSSGNYSTPDDGVNLDNPAYNTNSNYNLGNVIRMTQGRSFEFRNNIILWQIRDIYVRDDNNMFVTVSGVDRAVAEDCTVYVSCARGPNHYAYQRPSCISLIANNFCSIQRVTVYQLVQNGDYAGLGYGPWAEGFCTTIFKDITNKVLRYYNPAAKPTYMAGFLGAVARSYGVIQVENVDVDFDLCGYIYERNVEIWQAYGMGGDSAGRHTSNFPESYIRNVSVKSSDNPAPGWTNINQGHLGYPQLKLYVEPSNVRVDRIVSHHYHGCGADIGTVQGVPGPMLTNGSFKGTLAIKHWQHIDILDWATWSRSTNTNWTPLSVGGTCTVHIASATFGRAAGWTTEPVIYWSDGNSARVIIDNINVPANISYGNVPGNAKGQDGLAVYLNHVGGITGNFFADNYYYRARSWNVYRTGGGQAAIRLDRNAGSECRTKLALGPYALKSLQWTPNSAGWKKARIHVAFKNVADPSLLPARFQAQLDVPLDAVPNMTYISGNTFGNWLDDSSSVWNNDSGLTQRVLEIPFEAKTTLQPVSLHLWFDWWDSTPNFTFYLDPVVEFVGL